MLCFYKAKKPKVIKYNIEIVESQAINTYKMYYKGEGKDFIYAIITISTTI